MSHIEKIKLPAEFTYQFFQQNRYTISQTKHYQALCNNGFIKLYTPNGRIYWHVQNQFGHITPDWKFHISVAHQQIRQAWNLIAGLFVTMKCRTGMKTYYLKECVNPQNGRQITVYILKYSNKYEKSCFANDFELSVADQHSQQFWYEFVKNVEIILQSHEIESNGLAPGDLRIGKYVSLRNEAFVKNQKGQSIYPPNRFGWNPLNQQIPINIHKMQENLRQNIDEDQDDSQQSYISKNKNKIITIIIPVALAFLAYCSTRVKSQF